MKIIFDGISIEDAKPKEIADLIKAVRGKKISSTKAGAYKLPDNVIGKNSSHDAVDNAWSEEELRYIIENMDLSPRKMAEDPALANRTKPAIGAKKSAIKSGVRTRMGNVAYKIVQELGIRTNKDDEQAEL